MSNSSWRTRSISITKHNVLHEGVWIWSHQVIMRRVLEKMLIISISSNHVFSISNCMLIFWFVLLSTEQQLPSSFRSPRTIFNDCVEVMNFALFFLQGKPRGNSLSTSPWSKDWKWGKPSMLTFQEPNPEGIKKSWTRDLSNLGKSSQVWLMTTWANPWG